MYRDPDDHGNALFAAMGVGAGYITRSQSENGPPLVQATPVLIFGALSAFFFVEGFPERAAATFGGLLVGMGTRAITR